MTIYRSVWMWLAVCVGTPLWAIAIVTQGWVGDFFPPVHIVLFGVVATAITLGCAAMLFTLLESAGSKLDDRLTRNLMLVAGAAFTVGTVYMLLIPGPNSSDWVVPLFLSLAAFLFVGAAAIRAWVPFFDNVNQRWE